MYHSRNVVKRQERTLAVVVSSSDARACPHGLRRAGDLRVRPLAGQHAMGMRRNAEVALLHTPRVGTRASHRASQAYFPWTTRLPGVTIAGNHHGHLRRGDPSHMGARVWPSMACIVKPVSKFTRPRTLSMTSSLISRAWESGVAYPRLADKYSRPLASRLIGVNQPIIRTRNGFSTLHPTQLVCI